ncbi:hypothetical protein STH264 [Symbiobacterium thermophilum IAM 14863]|uniref:Uncharacterized protein n=1 Tax=Symbiobacterium thermophilum (strain DSM 24528 / JCM 14929 / IAM 14863 / T) TaxID=292459 RepID=Q67SU4_SYMTH|nr:hypothetical protein STH264 [Symbiobacterium thermophilum IAM 14863]
MRPVCLGSVNPCRPPALRECLAAPGEECTKISGAGELQLDGTSRSIPEHEYVTWVRPAVRLTIEVDLNRKLRQHGRSQ